MTIHFSMRQVGLVDFTKEWPCKKRVQRSPAGLAGSASSAAGLVRPVQLSQLV